MTAWPTLALALAALSALAAACDGRSAHDPDAAAAAQPHAPGSTRPLRLKIQGTWSIHPHEAAVEKMRSDLKRVAGSDEKRLQQMLERFRASMETMTLEFSGDRVITRDGRKEIASDPYEVVSESGNEIAIKTRQGRAEERFTFQDDDTVSADMKGLGRIVLKRR